METADQILQIKVSLKGRLLKTLRFSEPEINIGRDPDSDICLDNPGVSRQHCKLTRSNGGYLLQDLDSANGTYLNDSVIRRCEIRDQDVVRVGKFSLWLETVEDRRNLDDDAAGTPVVEGTTVLKTDQLERMLASAQEADREGAPRTVPITGGRDRATGAGAVRSRSWVPIALACFVAGAAIGSVVTWMLLSRAVTGGSPGPI